MLQLGEALQVTIHLNEDTGSDSGFLSQDVLEFLLDRGIAGATVLRGVAGFGAHGRLHRSDAGNVRGEHLPLILYFIDEKKKVESILADLLAMVSDGLVEAHPTQILKDVRGSSKVLS